MYSDETKKILENIIRGSLIEGSSDHCTAIRNYLCAGFSTSTTVKKDFEGKLLVKKEQESSLRNYANTHQLPCQNLLQLLLMKTQWFYIYIQLGC